MIPLLPPGLIFHSSSSSKSRYLSLVMMSTGSLAPSIVLSSPFSTFHTPVGHAQPPQETTMTPLPVLRRTGSILAVGLAAAALLLLPPPARAQAVKGTLLGT